MVSKLVLVGLVIAAAIAAVVTISRLTGRASHAEAVAKAYTQPAPPVSGALSVFHLGHSLVGRDMPAMLAQLSGPEHRYASQLGWGTSLKEHWEPDLPINGFEAENDHPHYRDAREALASASFDAFVMTEMVEIRDAIRYHQSARYLREWAALARAHNPAVRLYLYESWHRLDDAEGWLTRLDTDLARYWESKILLARPPGEITEHPIYVIPAGQVMAHLVRKVEAAGGVGPMRSREDLFARNDDGTLDTIHVNDLGAYLVALTHYAVLYQASPVGLPFELLRADGTPAASPGPDLARAMQESVWDVVRAYPKTGVRP